MVHLSPAWEDGGIVKNLRTISFTHYSMARRQKKDRKRRGGRRPALWGVDAPSQRDDDGRHLPGH